MEQLTKENGLANKEMEEENRYGQMVHALMVNGGLDV